MKKVAKGVLGLLTVLMAVYVTSAQAQDAEITFGAGFANVPEFEGSADHDIIPVGLFSAYWPSGRNVKFIGPKVSMNLLPHPRLRLGPVLQYRLGRDSTVENAAVSRLSAFDDAVEIGAYAGYELNRWNAFFQIVRDVAGGHDDFLATMGVGCALPISQVIDLAVKADVTWANSDYMDAYFSVTVEDSERSKLPAYDAESGFKDVGLSFSLRYSIDENWGVMGLLNYKRLIGDADNSPIVDDEGSANQLVYGVVATFSF